MKTAVVALFVCLVAAASLGPAVEGRRWRGGLVDRLRDCPRFCPAVYSPVCGSNGQIYSNLCHLNIAKCLTGDSSLTEASFSLCDPDHDFLLRDI
ncbi:thrombin inhibitor rhodniin-like [Branchiostoma floridae]|uniref:Thrombin inhibitor rhodniin-like n=1 Tax=Branchiostoma floridae TaxID=7739 RepID=A0A9J7NCZ3_BRAFL|nr:thrombin inhibitor rhodniin-like [Branchiostoma floridae]